MVASVRKPAVAGRFYPAQPDKLLGDVESHLPKPSRKVRALGVISPHAGFMYSGDVAGSVYASIEIPDTIILLGPNHTGQGKPVALMHEGVWQMPFGEVPVDRELACKILEASPLIERDSKAHEKEHALETQLPFIQYYRKQIQIVPMTIKRQSVDACRQVAEALVSIIKNSDRSILIVASSDMSHYESHETAKYKDRLAIDQVIQMNAEGLYQTVTDHKITMCGIMPSTVMLMAVNRLGARQAELTKYMTSGETSGDFDRVVGYAGIVIQEQPCGPRQEA